MNYLELINKCLVELNYKQVNAFSELIKNDHKKLKNIINVINTEICGFDRWNFLLRKTELVVPANTGETENTIDGRIETVIVDGVKFEYYEDFEKFFVNCTLTSLVLKFTYLIFPFLSFFFLSFSITFMFAFLHIFLKCVFTVAGAIKLPFK